MVGVRWWLELRTGMRYISGTSILGSIDISYRRSVYRSKYRKGNILTLWRLPGEVPAKTNAARVLIF